MASDHPGRSTLRHRLLDFPSNGEVVTSPTIADVAQLVERNLAKVEVAGSSPVVRSLRAVTRPPSIVGDVAEWLGKGLQNPVLGFDSRRRLWRYNGQRQGRLAQRESAASTRQRSLVQSQ